MGWAEETMAADAAPAAVDALLAAAAPAAHLCQRLDPLHIPSRS